MPIGKPDLDVARGTDMLGRPVWFKRLVEYAPCLTAPFAARGPQAPGASCVAACRHSPTEKPQPLPEPPRPARRCQCRPRPAAGPTSHPLNRTSSPLHLRGSTIPGTRRRPSPVQKPGFFLCKVALGPIPRKSIANRAVHHSYDRDCSQLIMSGYGGLGIEG